MKDKKDQCVQCGGIRVTGHTLCGDCIAALSSQRLEKNDILETESKELKRKVQKLTKLCERLLDHIANDTVQSGELQRAAYAAWLQKK